MGIGKFADHKQFVNFIREIGGIFQNADREKLEAALKNGDLKGACTALRMNEHSLTSLFQRGAIEAAKVVQETPELAVDALKEHTANGRRP